MARRSRSDVLTALQGALERLSRVGQSAMRRGDVATFAAACELATPLAGLHWHLSRRRIAAAPVAALLPGVAQYVAELDASRSSRGRDPVPTSATKPRKHRKRSEVKS